MDARPSRHYTAVHQAVGIHPNRHPRTTTRLTGPATKTRLMQSTMAKMVGIILEIASLALTNCPLQN